MKDAASATWGGAVPAPEREERLLLCALVEHAAARPDAAALEVREALGAALAMLSDRVMWLERRGGAGGLGALLDLGRCPLEEAQTIAERLIADLTRRGFAPQAVRAGAGPTQTLARLAALLAAPGSARALDHARLAATRRDLAIDLFAQLEPNAITPEVLERLRRYGLTTWGHIARVDARDPQALRRQFGPAGAALGALARGDDPRLFAPTAPPERVRARRRFAPEATAAQALAAAEPLAASLARRLAASGKQGRDLRLRVDWESGAVSRARRRLARPLSRREELTQATRNLLTNLLASGANDADGAHTTGAVASLTLTLGDLSARLEAQPEPLFISVRVSKALMARRERAARMARIVAEISEPLARRYGAPVLYHLEAAQPDAILPEERAWLAPLSVTAPAPVESAASVTPTRRQPRDVAAAVDGVTPPQPHWW